MSKRIFITGGAGFIGSHLINKLLDMNFEVASLDKNLSFIDNSKYYQRCRKLRKKYLKKPSKTYLADIRNEASVKKAIEDFRPEIIVHLAGLPMARVLEKYNDDMISINLYGSLNVLKAFEKSKAEKLIYTSSSMVYGHFRKGPHQPEDSILSPENSYGATKAVGEYFVKLSAKEWVIVRPTSVYGFTDCANRVTQLLIDAAICKKKAWLVKGETLDFSYIDDVVDGFIKSITLPQAVGKTFNISRGERRTVSEFAEILRNYFPEFKCEIRNPDSKQVWRGSLDITKARKVLKFDPKYNIEAGIKKTLELIKEYNFYNFEK